MTGLFNDDMMSSLLASTTVHKNESTDGNNNASSHPTCASIVCKIALRVLRMHEMDSAGIIS